MEDVNKTERGEEHGRSLEDSLEFEAGMAFREWQNMLGSMKNHYDDELAFDAFFAGYSSGRGKS